MSVWKITGISLLAASIMGAIFLLASPAQAACFNSDSIFETAHKEGSKATRLEGDKFRAFMQATIAKYGPYSGDYPDHIILMWHDTNPVARIYFILESGDACIMMNVLKAQIDSLIKASNGNPT